MDEILARNTEIEDTTLSGATDTTQFAHIMYGATDRELLEFVAFEVFLLKTQVGAFLPKMEQLANGPMMGMLGSLFK